MTILQANEVPPVLLVALVRNAKREAFEEAIGFHQAYLARLADPAEAALALARGVNLETARRESARLIAALQILLFAKSEIDRIAPSANELKEVQADLERMRAKARETVEVGGA